MYSWREIMCTSWVCLSWGMYLIGVYLIGVYLLGVHLMGVHLTGCASLERAYHWACTSLDVYLMGVVCVETFRFFNLGFLGKSPYTHRTFSLPFSDSRPMNGLTGA